VIQNCVSCALCRNLALCGGMKPAMRKRLTFFLVMGLGFTACSRKTVSYTDYAGFLECSGGRRTAGPYRKRTAGKSPVAKFFQSRRRRTGILHSGRLQSGMEPRWQTHSAGDIPHRPCLRHVVFSDVDSGMRKRVALGIDDRTSNYTRLTGLIRCRAFRRV
jgi:hypothetical protein